MTSASTAPGQQLSLYYTPFGIRLGQYKKNDSILKDSDLYPDASSILASVPRHIDKAHQ